MQPTTNAVLAVKHRFLNDQEIAAQDVRRSQLEPLEADEVEDEVEVRSIYYLQLEERKILFPVFDSISTSCFTRKIPQLRLSVFSLFSKLSGFLIIPYC